ncbi:MAG: ATP-binding cassette domain-containing protein [Rhodobacteraceae bacterium]|nr:ATP-binding cassette domain-containing protein [Paracoccaceae bacterium]
MPDRQCIEVDNLRKSFGASLVLDDVSLQVDRGNSLVVIGESGSGKSVLLKCMLGLLTPDSGSVVVEGNSVATHRESFLDRCGVLFQGGALFDSIPVWQNVAFRRLHGSGRLSARQARQLGEEKLERVGLDRQVANLFPIELSGGMQKRVALARAIACNPDYLFFDEPTAGLDPIRSNDISALISDVASDMKVTTVTVTHDMGCVRAVASGIMMLRQGRISWFGDLDEFDKASNRYVARFSGSAQCAIDENGNLGKNMD